MTTQPTGVEGALRFAISQRAADWYPDAVPAELTLIDHAERPASSVYRYRLGRDGPTVIAKVPRVVADSSPRPRVRPRYYPATTRHRTDIAARALQAAAEHFAALGDPRLHSLRFLDQLEEPDAVVTEFVPWPDLHRLFLRSAISRRTGPAVLTAFANAGAWLRSYHSSTPSPAAEPRDEHVGDYLATLQRLAGYLRERLGADDVLESVASTATRRAHELLPDPMPLVTAHGDFGPSNVLVAPDGGVAVLDLNGRWLAPAYEDAANFVAALRTTGAGLVSRDRALSRGVVNDAEQAFLRGFHPDGVPDGLLLYRLNATLDAWGSKLRRFAGWRRRLIEGGFRRELEAIGRDLRG